MLRRYCDFGNSGSFLTTDAPTDDSVNAPACPPKAALSLRAVHREHHAKREVLVYDYVDSGVGMLARMALKRQVGYRSLGYEIATAESTTTAVQNATVSSDTA